MRILVLDDDDVRHEWFHFFIARHDNVDLVQVRTFQGALDALIENPQFDVVYLDHDLNDYHYRSYSAPEVKKEDKARYELTGFDVAKYIVDVMDDKKRPKQVVVHSWNPPAAEGMMELFREKIPARRWLFNSKEDPLDDPQSSNPGTRLEEVSVKDPVFRLEVQYPLEKFDVENESVIHGIVGRPTSSAGTNLITSGRDLSYEFKDKREAKKALGRLKSSRYKWMKMVIEQD